MVTALRQRVCTEYITLLCMYWPSLVIYVRVTSLSVCMYWLSFRHVLMYYGLVTSLWCVHVLVASLCCWSYTGDITVLLVIHGLHHCVVDYILVTSLCCRLYTGYITVLLVIYW